MAVDPSNCWWLHREACILATWDAMPVDTPNWPTGIPNALCTSFPPSHSWQDTQLCSQTQIQASPMSPKHTHSGGSSQWDGEKTYKLEYFSGLSSGEQMRGSLLWRLSTWPGFERPKEGMRLKNSPIRENKGCEVGASIGKVCWEPQNPYRADWWKHSFPKASY